MLCCPKCGEKMNKVLHFEKDKNIQFLRCKNKKCYFKTDERKLILNSLK